MSESVDGSVCTTLGEAKKFRKNVRDSKRIYDERKSNDKVFLFVELSSLPHLNHKN